jgi:hypothetical protein
VREAVPRRDRDRPTAWDQASRETAVWHGLCWRNGNPTPNPSPRRGGEPERSFRLPLPAAGRGWGVGFPATERYFFATTSRLPAAVLPHTSGEYIASTRVGGTTKRPIDVARVR